MSQNVFSWMGRSVAFREGESIAAALEHVGIRCFGKDDQGQPRRYFCGIGACQNCLVLVDGKAVEACLTPAGAGLVVRALEVPHG
jgi:aerobic-type carbon monoxide dehydrogenase small subunit (CoxS/CutS family)